MNCKDCGEQMEGDGYTTVFHCPNVDDVMVSKAQKIIDDINAGGVY